MTNLTESGPHTPNAYNSGRAPQLLNGRLITSVVCALLLGLLGFSFKSKSSVSAQQVQMVTISGVILDNNSRPMVDIVVSVEGTRRASVVTAGNGYYSVAVPQGGN